MKRLLLASTAAIFVVHSGVANAQDAPSPAPVAGAAQATPADKSASGLADIVVTAQRRDENLQRAALAVSAVAGDTLTSKASRRRSI